VLCTYPTGESALTSWPYQIGVVTVSLVAATALLRGDPLNTHAIRRSGMPDMEVV
jgi:hypothetical protein